MIRVFRELHGIDGRGSGARQKGDVNEPSFDKQIFDVGFSLGEYPRTSGARPMTFSKNLCLSSARLNNDRKSLTCEAKPTISFSSEQVFVRSETSWDIIQENNKQ